MDNNNDQVGFCIDLKTFHSMSKEDKLFSKHEFERLHKLNPDLQCYKLPLSNNKLGIISDKLISEDLGYMYSLSIIDEEKPSSLTYEEFMKSLEDE